MSTMSTTEFNVERVLELVSVLPTTDQWTIAESILRGLKKSSKAGKTSKAKKERDPDAPKREPSDWIKHTTHVRQFLADEHKGVACTQIASMLKTEGKMFADEADVMDAYARWKENPPVKADKKSVSEASDSEKPKRKSKAVAKKAAKSDSESDTESDAESVAPPPVAKPAKKASKKAESDADSVAPPPKPAAKPAEKPAKKAAVEPVTKPAKKAAVEPVAKPAVEPKKMAKVMKPKAEAAPPAPVAAPPKAVTKTVAKTVTMVEAKVEAKVETEVAQEGEFWDHDFGSGVVQYERFPGDEAGTFHIFHPTDGHMGLWDELKEELDPDVADPTA
jgi:hypothetical protein